MPYRWIINGKLAISRYPLPSEVIELSKIFDAVVILIEPHEYTGVPIQTYLRRWRSLGAEVFYSPTRDWWPPHLLELYHIVKWIKNHIDQGDRVLVHCMGGIGRSGTVAAAYLVYALGYKPWDAVVRVRRRVPGALEVPRQEKMVYTLHYLLEYLPEPLLSRIDSIALERNYGAGIKHVSKVTQLAIDLVTDLGITRDIPYKLRNALAIASILHDIVFNQEPHGIRSMEYIREVLGKQELGFKKELVEEIAKYVKCHHIEWCTKEEYSIGTVMLQIADHLDHGFDQTVDYIEALEEENGIRINIYCELPCNHNINELFHIKDLVEETLGKPLLL